MVSRKINGRHSQTSECFCVWTGSSFVPTIVMRSARTDGFACVCQRNEIYWRNGRKFEDWTRFIWILDKINQVNRCIASTPSGGDRASCCGGGKPSARKIIIFPVSVGDVTPRYADSLKYSPSASNLASIPLLMLQSIRITIVCLTSLENNFSLPEYQSIYPDLYFCTPLPAYEKYSAL